MATAFIGLGANLGDRLSTLQSAVDRLRSLGAYVVTSSIYETDPVGFTDQPPFLNAVVQFDTSLKPRALLAELQRIETDHARVRTFRNAPRTLDLDLLLYDDLVIHEPGLTVPHPRMHERAFVLAPLAEIEPDVMHPVLDRSAAGCLAGLGQVPGVAPIAKFDDGIPSR